MANKRRFSVKYKEGALVGTRIITDTQTGVQYLFAFDGNSGGLTILADKDGKPLCAPQSANE